MSWTSALGSRGGPYICNLRLGRPKQEDHRLKASLSYLVSPPNSKIKGSSGGYGDRAEIDCLAFPRPWEEGKEGRRKGILTVDTRGESRLGRPVGVLSLRARLMMLVS